MRIKAVIAAAFFALGLVGMGSANAGVEVCYEFHINIADTIVQDSGPVGEPVCQTIDIPAP